MATQAVLLMLSGGLDSTYLLHHYLTRTTIDVHAHHISIRYAGAARWQQEALAVQRIVGHCRANYRAFTYTESVFTMDLQGDLGWDSDLQLLVASKAVPSIKADHVTVALGWGPEDLQRPEVAARRDRHVTPNLWRALRASINRHEHVNPELAMPLVDMSISKVQMMTTLPRELLRWCWSCRLSIKRMGMVGPCGKCHACVLNEQAMRAAGIEPQELPNLAFLAHRTGPLG